MDVITFPEHLQTTSGLSILLHGVTSLPDEASNDNIGSLFYQTRRNNPIVHNGLNVY